MQRKEMDNRPEHVKRMYKEWKELQAKLVDIYYFIECSKTFTELDEKKQKLLTDQKSAMYSYQDILTERLKLEERSSPNEGETN